MVNLPHCWSQFAELMEAKVILKLMRTLWEGENEHLDYKLWSGSGHFVGGFVLKPMGRVSGLSQDSDRTPLWREQPTR